MENNETTLTPAAMRALAETFTGEVVDYIFADERWAEFLMEIVPEVVAQKVGNLPCDDVIELSMMIMDRIYIKRIDR